MKAATGVIQSPAQEGAPFRLAGPLLELNGGVPGRSHLEPGPQHCSKQKTDSTCVTDSPLAQP